MTFIDLGKTHFMRRQTACKPAPFESLYAFITVKLRENESTIKRSNSNAWPSGQIILLCGKN